MPLRALVFDLDGLILDTEGPEFASWVEEYAALGFELTFEAYQASIGTVGAWDPYDHLEQLLGDPLDREAVRARRRARFEALMEVEGVLPGVETLIAEATAAGLALGLASSSARAWVLGFLERFGLDGAFDAMAVQEDVAHVKPAPDLYLAVLRALGIEPGDAVAFEDSPNGVRAAKAAGVFCVAVPNALTRRMEDAEADLTLDTLEGVRLADVRAWLGQ